MKKFFAFCKRHLSEMVFAVWTLVLCLNAKGFGLGLAGGFLVNICLAWLLSCAVRTRKQLNVLKWCAFVSTAVIAVVFWLVASQYWYNAVVGALFCWLISIVAADKASKLNIELEDLRNSDPDAYIRRMVKLGRPLDQEYEERMLQFSDAENLVGKYIQQSRFWKPVENKFLKDRRFKDLWGEYFKCYDLWEEQEMELFNRPDAKEIIGLYCSCSQMCERAELKLFTMPDAKEWVKMYIERGAFYSEKAENKLFQMADAKELIEFYKSKYALFYSTEDLLHPVALL